MEKPFWKSKAKIGAILLTGSTILGAVGGYLTGAMDVSQLIQALMGIGAGIGIWGVRDAQK
jgi:hypothetical protein